MPMKIQLREAILCKITEFFETFYYTVISSRVNYHQNHQKL